MNKQSKIYTLFFIFIVSFIFVFILSLANEFTKERIEINNQLFEIKAVLYAFNIEYTSNNDAYNKFEDLIEVKIINNEKIFITEKNGEDYFGILFTGNALWGPVLGIVTINNDYSRIYGMDIISHNETPGLGGRIEEEWFKQQFQNLKLDNRMIRVIVTPREGDDDKDNSKVDSVTGATNTSLSIETIINNNIKKLIELLEVIR